MTLRRETRSRPGTASRCGDEGWVFVTRGIHSFSGSYPEAAHRADRVVHDPLWRTGRPDDHGSTIRAAGGI
jgi:hypothetical protein